MNITKVYIRKWESGSLLGFADVVINNYMTFRGFKIFKKKDGNGIAVLPPAQKSNKPDEDGKDRYFDVIKFDMKNEEAKKEYWSLINAVKDEWNGNGSQEKFSNATNTKEPTGAKPSQGWDPESEDIPF